MQNKKRQICIILFFLLFSFSKLSTVYGQSFAKESNSTKLFLSDLFQQLKKEKQVTFLYEPKTIEGVLVSTTFNVKADVKTILKKILPPVGLKFRKVGKEQ